MSTFLSVAGVTTSVLGVVLVAASIPVYRRWDTPGTRVLALVMIFLGIGGVGTGPLSVGVGRLAATTWLHQFVELSSIAWFVFALQYTGRDYLLTRPRVQAFAVGYAAIWLASLAPVFDLFSSEAITTLIPVVRYMGGVVLVLLAGTLLVQTTYLHGYLSGWTGLALGVVAFDPWFVLLVGFGVDEVGLPVVTALYAVGLLVAVALLWVIVFRQRLLAVTAGTFTLGRRAIVAETADIVSIVDESDRIVELNDAAVRRLDAPRPAYTGEQLTDLVGETSETLSDRSSIEIQDTSGVRQYDVQVIDLSDTRGYRMGRLVSLRDVTERRQREQMLEVLNRVLRHNLRNELSVVTGRTTIVAEKLDDPELEDHLARADRAVDNLVALGDQARSVSTAVKQDQSGLSTVAVDQLVDDSVETVTREQTGTVTVDGDSPQVATHRSLLELAVRNVVENALEHNTAQEPKAVVTLSSEAGGVRISVSDNGPGIPASERAAIEEGRETPLDHSSSLGLWVVNWAVTACGGTVSFENGDDGACVEIWVPDRSERLVSTER